MSLWQAVFVFALVYLTPDREDPTPKKDPVPQIAGPSHWGFIANNPLDINKYTIWGHSQWGSEEAEIKDGKFLVKWLYLSDGRNATGVYKINPQGELVGQWHWDNEPQTLNDEVLRGPLKEIEEDD